MLNLPLPPPNFRGLDPDKPIRLAGGPHYSNLNISNLDINGSSFLVSN